MTVKKGFKFDIKNKTIEQQTAEKIADEFITQLNLFHACPSPRDSQVDLYLHQCYADVLRRRSKGFENSSKPYFSPSSSGSCPRELYLKVKGAERDTQEVRPHQTRWQHIGTKIGDMVQEQVLLMEYHLERLTGVSPKFKFCRNTLSEPLFEEFAYKRVPVGDKYYLMGTTDGIMQYTDSEGNTIRVGLEVKSKQTSYSQTGDFSLKEANPKHTLQTVAYSLMYEVDYWIILYVNASKKAWSMEEADLKKYPDIKAFGHYVTKEMKQELLNKFDGIIDAVENETPPALDLENWTFNNYKRACALDLTANEYVELVNTYLDNSKKGNKPPYILKSMKNALEEIKEIRRSLNED